MRILSNSDESKIHHYKILSNSEKSLIINNKLDYITDSSTLKANKLDYLIESSAAMFKDGETKTPSTKPSETEKSWRRAVPIEPVKKPEPICKSTEECNKLVGKYKQTCRRRISNTSPQIWDEKCDESNTIEKLTAISNNAKSCASAREDYQKQCCIGIDQGHVGAILKMKRLAEKCDAIRFNKLTNL